MLMNDFKRMMANAITRCQCEARCVLYISLYIYRYIHIQRERDIYIYMSVHINVSFCPCSCLYVREGGGYMCSISGIMQTSKIFNVDIFRPNHQSRGKSASPPHPSNPFIAFFLEFHAIFSSTSCEMGLASNKCKRENVCEEKLVQTNLHIHASKCLNM